MSIPRRYLPIILAVMVWLLAAATVQADSDSDDRMLHFSISMDEPTTVDRQLHIAFKRMGYDVTFEATGMTNAIQVANSGEKDGLYCQVPGLEKNFPNLVMVPVQLETVKFEAYALKGGHRRVSSWADLSGLRVGTMFQKHYIHNHLPPDIADLIQEESTPSLIQALIDGECDVIVMTNSLVTDVIMPATVEKIGLADQVPSYPYLNKKHADLVPELTRVLVEMKKEGLWEKIVNRRPLNDLDRHSVLHLSSYYGDMELEKEIGKGLEDVLVPQGVDIYTVSLNSNRILDDNGRAKSVFTALRNSLLNRVPDAVIVSGDNARTFIENYYSRLFTQVPVIFCSVTRYRQDDIWKMENRATGTEENPAAFDTVTEMLRLFPHTSRLLVLNDNLETGRLWRREIERQLEPFASQLEIVYNDNIPLSELLTLIRALPRDTLILSGFYNVDGNGVNYSTERIQTSLAEASPVPIFGLMDTTIGYGQVGGKYTNAKEEARRAAGMALAIIDGAEPGALPVRYGGQDDNLWIFDYTALSKWQINTDLLPPGALVINKPVTLKESNPTAYYLGCSLLIVTMMVISGLGSFLLLLSRQNRKLVRTQKSLHTAEELLEKDEQIKKVKERLEKTLESAPLVYMLLVDGVITETNAYLKKHLNLPLGANVRRLFSHRLEYLNQLRQMLKDHGAVYGEVCTFETVDDGQHRFHLNLALVEYEGQQATVVWGVDIEESEGRKDALALAQAELQILVDAVPTPLFIVEPETFVLQYANQAFLDLFGCRSKEEVIGLSTETMHPELQPNGERSAEAVRAYVKKALSSDHPSALIWTFNRPDGRALYAKVVTSSIVYNHLNCLVVAIQDLEAEKKQEEMLVAAARKEREANQMKSVFLMNMSHEIRTPMNAIIGFSQLGLHQTRSPEAAEAFQKINVSARNLLSIINDLLDFSKIEAEKMELFPAEFDLEELIANAALVASEKIGDKTIEMLLDIDPEVPRYLIGDRTRIWQILKNILDNAAKYSEVGRIVLKVSAEEEGSDERTVALRLTVADTGLGMSPEQLEHLFLPFEQFHNNAKNNLTGTGLGMPITKQLVELMAGSIAVESRVRVGTTFTVRLPLALGENRGSIAQALDGRALDGQQVLVADDDEYALKIMSDLLRQVGVNPVCVASGSEALAKAREHDRRGTPFKIIILDYLLGADNGIEVAREMRKIAADQASFLLVSAYAKQLLIKDIAAAGFNDVIDKPFVPSAFINKLGRTAALKAQGLRKSKYPQFPEARILVCEDNIYNQDVIRGMLGLFGIQPVIAGHGQEGLEALEREDFHLVFMDIMMPVMDGHEATAAIRQSDQAYRDVPIVAMTANVMREEVDRCLKEGMNGHLGKPMEIRQVQQCLQLYLPAGLMVRKPDVEAAAASGLQALELLRSEIEGVDVAAGIERFGGSAENYFKSLAKFAKTLGDLPAYAEAAEHREDLIRRIHTLKGVSANFGLNPLYKETMAFEKELLAGVGTEAGYQRLRECCDLFQTRILAHFSGQSRAEGTVNTGGWPELGTRLKQISAAFDASELDRCETLIRSLTDTEWVKIDRSRFDSIVHLVKEYDFEGAIALFDGYESAPAG